MGQLWRGVCSDWKRPIEVTLHTLNRDSHGVLLGYGSTRECGAVGGDSISHHSLDGVDDIVDIGSEEGVVHAVEAFVHAGAVENYRDIEGSEFEYFRRQLEAGVHMGCSP